MFLFHRIAHDAFPESAVEIWPQGLKFFFEVISAEHEMFSANQYENANNSWQFHIY